MTALYRYEIQLHDRGIGAFAGPAITTSGGKFIATVAGSPLRAALKSDKIGTALSQATGVALTAGRKLFYSTESSLDLFIQTGDGQFVDMYGLKPDQLHEIPVDRSRHSQMMVIPFHITDYPTGVETDTGFDQSLTMAMAPWPIVQVTTADASDTIDVGTDGSGGNDPDGFVDGVALDNALLVKATSVNTNTIGAKLIEQDSANAGDEFPTVYINSAAEDITITMTGTTGAGFVHLPYFNYTRNQPTLT